MERLPSLFELAFLRTTRRLGFPSLCRSKNTRLAEFLFVLTRYSEAVKWLTTKRRIAG